MPDGQAHTARRPEGEAAYKPPERRPSEPNSDYAYRVKVSQVEWQKSTSGVSTADRLAAKVAAIEAIKRGDA